MARKLSEYNKFVQSYMKKHKGCTIADAAKAWSGSGKKKGGAVSGGKVRMRKGAGLLGDLGIPFL